MRKYLTEQESYIKKLSRAHLQTDMKMKRLPKELHKKILNGGIPCGRCGFVVDENTYGGVVRNPKRAKVRCYYCTTVSDF